MIAFLPKAYPDELLYSRLSRYHQRSGYVRHISTAEDIYQAGKATHPSIEFVNKYTDDAMAWLTKDVPWETVVEKHTMYPAYIRFLPLCRRKEAVEGVIVQDGNWKNLMHLHASDEKRYLRYCPLCAEEDRETYGETYWHRGHQIPHIRVCHKHGVFLSSSIIPIASKTSSGLFDAQSDVPEATAVRCCENEREIEFARYAPTGERIFSKAEMKNHLNLHTLRAQAAKETYKYLENELSIHGEGYRRKLEAELRETWNKYNINPKTGKPKPFPKNRLTGTYFLRGKSKAFAIKNNLPLFYDRLLVFYVSVFKLAHYRLGVTVQSYLNIKT